MYSLERFNRRMFSIYGLCDPTNNQLRYVGATKGNLDSRLKAHIKGSILGRTHKDFWIKKLISKKILPEIFLIEQISETDWQESEKFWINYFNYIGCDLTNKAMGGNGGNTRSGMHHSEETKKRIKENNIGKNKGKLLGKTYEEIHGVDKAIRLRKVKTEKLKGRKMLPSQIAKSVETRKRKGSYHHKRSKWKSPNKRKGKTYEEIFGVEKAKDLRIQLSLSHRKID